MNEWSVLKGSYTSFALAVLADPLDLKNVILGGLTIKIFNEHHPNPIYMASQMIYFINSSNPKTQCIRYKFYNHITFCIR